ncbi:disulfide isomerase DsbC N-terminal domain-containing protein [Enterobacter hormaechei]
MVSGLVRAEESLPDVVKHFSEQQDIRSLRKTPRRRASVAGAISDMGVTLFLTPDGKHVVSGYLYDEKGTNLSEAFFHKEILRPDGPRDVKSECGASLKEARRVPAQSLRL